MIILVKKLIRHKEYKLVVDIKVLINVIYAELLFLEKHGHGHV